MNNTIASGLMIIVTVIGLATKNTWVFGICAIGVTLIATLNLLYETRDQ
jgi:ABC-type cobalamin transport system permease subunit